jgi:lipopolysaccharide export LptBFGC system permease protein LptF
MFILKKLKSATLIEAIIATVLIVIVFIMASLVLNNLILNTYSKNTYVIAYRLNELEYNLQNKTIQLPYEENYEGWNITIAKEKIKSDEFVTIKANNDKTDKAIIRQRIYEN